MQRGRRTVPSRSDRAGTAAWWRPAGGAHARPAPLPEPGGDDDAQTVEVPVTGSAERADSLLPPRPATATRPPRAGRPGRLPPARAVAGAAVAVAGVCLGIGTLLWATDAPTGSPALQLPAAGTSGGDEPAVALPGDDGAPAEVETVPVDPPPLPDPEPDPETVAEPVAETVTQTVAEPPVPVAAVPARPAIEPVPVLVLNNSRVEGLAARAAATFERGGWPVKDTGGLRGRIRATTVYYPPGQEAVARAFAARFDGVDRVLPRLAGLPGTGLTVVVTRDFRP